MNKSSKDHVDDDDGSDQDDQDDGDSQSSSGQSDVFVRTKAANISSFDDPAENVMDTVKNNEAIAEGQPGVQGSSLDQSYASEMKNTITKTVVSGADVKRRPVDAKTKIKDFPVV